MKARRSGTTNQWKEIKYVQLEDSDILYKAEAMEFDAAPSEFDVLEQMELDNSLRDHWQDVRERAAIAAMQGVMNFVGSVDYNKDVIARLAVEQADALIEELKQNGL